MPWQKHRVIATRTVAERLFITRRLKVHNGSIPARCQHAVVLSIEHGRRAATGLFDLRLASGRTMQGSRQMRWTMKALQFDFSCVVPNSESLTMPSFLYTASVPVLLRYLDRLSELVDLAERHTELHHQAAEEILDARLSDDMLPLELQVQIASNFALRASFPLAGKAVPPYGEFPASFAGLRSRIARNASLVRELNCSDFDDAASRMLQDVAGQAVVSLPASEFLLQYALPNFFFHISIAYAILRKSGVAAGKQDFDGFHSYPRGA